MADNLLDSNGNSLRALEDTSSDYWFPSVRGVPTTVSGGANVITVYAGAALADGMSNPTAQLDASCGMVWNGSTWDRLPGSTSGVKVQLPTGAATSAKQDTQTSHLASIMAYLGYTIYVDDADWTALTSRHTLIGGVYQSSPGTITDGDTGPLRLTQNGAAHVAVQNTVTVDGSGVTQPISASSLPLPTGAATAANQSTANTALSAVQAAVEVMDDWDESDRCAVNPISGQAGVAGGSGTVGATTQRVTLASDDPAVALLGTIDTDTSNINAAVNNIYLAVQVDSLTNTMDSIASSAFGYLFNGTSWDRWRGNATDGALVNLGANNDVTVSGTVLDAIQAAVEVMDDWDESDRCAVNPISGQAGVAGGSGTVGATTQRVTLATDVALPGGSNTIGKVDHATTGIDDGSKDVTTAGTAVALAGSTAAKWVVITAKSNNTGNIYVGGASISSSTGTPLAAGDSLSLPCDNLSDVYIDADNDGEGVTYTHGT